MSGMVNAEGHSLETARDTGWHIAQAVAWGVLAGQWVSLPFVVLLWEGGMSRLFLPLVVVSWLVAEAAALRLAAGGG
jgi:hypothetical protein